MHQGPFWSNKLAREGKPTAQKELKGGSEQGLHSPVMGDIGSAGRQEKKKKSQNEDDSSVSSTMPERGYPHQRTDDSSFTKTSILITRLLSHRFS